MIHLTNISKQHGSQILFKNASLQILTGTRTGLVDRVSEIDRGTMTAYKGDYEYYLSKTGRDHREI